ncbi:MAG: RagB/SusD family nutrient uptake outer membrane protein, partial [Bacteroidetes bacterium]|nr:RagB/SusD family nutrient uptake outer membrane protein [Bacteroidota bacterium]
MRFTRYNLIASVFALGVFTSCKKEYLDDQPYSSVLLVNAIKSESDLAGTTTGMYSSLRTTDLYGRTLPVKGDIMADNTFVITSNSGRYTTLNSYILTASDAYALGVWQNAYIAIKYANTIIAAAPTLTQTANVKQYLGEAYAVRALMHFELVRNFGHPYTAAPNDPGVPIVLKFDQNALPGRNTVKEVYTQIIADLEQAYSLMSSYRGSAYFSKYAARALEARVYQHMGDWANAKTTALDVINNSGVTLAASTAYVAYWASPAVQASTSKIETLFEVASDYTTNNGFDQIGFIYLTTGGGYGDILANSDLYNLYSATDVRKSLMSTGTRSGQSGTAYFCQKYINAANTTDKDDTKVLRLADVILIAAEAYYNTSDITNANIYLNKVAQ